jgi:superfamily II DNA/RNA helicase
MHMMNVTEKRIIVSLEPPTESQYIQLMNEYFAASERNSRASSIHEKKQIMAIKENMAVLCNRNPPKLQALKTIIKEVDNAREKLLVLSKSNAVVSEIHEELAADEEIRGVLLLTTELSIHEIKEKLDRFNKSSGSTVLIASDSINTGLDFTAANHMVHYDYPGKYSELLQRHLRIMKQTSYHSSATVYYLITKDRIDEFDYWECINEKEAIESTRSNVE